MKKTFRQAMLSTICMLVVAVISLTGVTYAWFSQGTTADVADFNVTVQSAGGTLRMGYQSGDSIVWGNTVNPLTEAVTGLAPVSTAGIVSNGEMQFFTAEIDEQSANQDKLKSIQAASKVVGSTNNWVAFDLFFDNSTNASALPIYLDNTSSITAAGTTNKSELAARFAFVVQQTDLSKQDAVTPADFTGKGTTSVIFEPNYDTHTAAGIRYQTVSGLGTADAKYPYYGINAAAASANRYNDQTVMQSVTTRTIGDTNAIVTVGANCYAKVTVYIWLEGQDADCLNDIASTTFTVNLNFNLQQPTIG